MSEKISIIIPIYNEEKNIQPLCDEIFDVLKKDFSSFQSEIIIVNDWSTDGSWSKICEIKDKKKENIKAINLQKNYGQSTALDVGFGYANWDYIVTLDWDWQDNPHEIKKLYDKLKKDNLDVVAWRRKERKDKLQVRIITKLARFFRKMLINDKIHDSWCTLRIYKKECIKQLHLRGEMHRYILEILQIKWYRISEVEVEHRARRYGKSKYNWEKTIKGFIDLLYIRFIAKYQSRPLHLFWSVGILSLLIWFISFCFSFYEKIFHNLSLNRNGFFLLWVFLIQTWIMIFIFWILIDILIRIYHNSWEEKAVLIKEIKE